MLWTSLGMQVVGTLVFAAAIFAVGRWPTLGSEYVPLGAVFAVLGVGSLFLFYKALALGPISVVSPVAASYAALTVVLVVLFLGEQLSVGQATAIAITFVGVVLSSTDVRQLVATLGRPLPGVRYGLAATLGFGLFGAVVAAAAKQYDGMALVLVGRISSVILLAAIVLALRSAIPGDRRPATLGLIATVGVFDTAANVSFVLGVQSGYASIVATGSGLYPVLPAMLAIGFLGERLAPNQYLGILVVVAGLVALGLQG